MHPPLYPLPVTRLLHDMEAALDRMGSWDLYAEIGHAFAESLPATETAIADAVGRGGWAEAHRLVHSLKGNCAAMGAEALRSQAYTLEKACADADGETAARLFTVLREEFEELRKDLLAL